MTEVEIPSTVLILSNDKGDCFCVDYLFNSKNFSYRALHYILEPTSVDELASNDTYHYFKTKESLIDTVYCFFKEENYNIIVKDEGDFSYCFEEEEE